MTIDESPAGLLGRGYRTLRREGPQAFAMRALAFGVHRRLLLVERPVPRDLPPVDAAPTIGAGAIADPSEVFALRPRLPRTVVAEYVRRGAVLFGVRHEGRLVAARWIMRRRGWIAYLARSLALADDECFAADTYTHPEFRGRGINGVLSIASLGHAHEMGAAVSLAAILPENAAGLRAALRAGYGVTGRIGWTGVGPARRYFATRTTGPITWAPRRPL